MVCREVEALRLLGPSLARARAADKLVRRYCDGRRCASDVVDALSALDAQNRHAECSLLLVEAFRAVQPIPTVLWLWACGRLAVLGVDALRFMLRLASISPRHRKHLWPHRDALKDTPDGMVALLHESQAFPDWAPHMAEQAFARLVGSRSGTASRSEAG